MLADGLAEGVPLLGVGDGVLEGGLGDAHAAGGDVDAADLKRAHDVLEATALVAAEEVAGGDAGVVEGELGGLDALVSELLELAADEEALGVGLDEEGADAAMGGLGVDVGLGEDEVDARALAVGDPHLLAVNDVVVAVAGGLRLDGLGVGAGVGLGDAEGGADLGVDHAGEEALLLLLGAVGGDGVADKDVRVEDAGEAHPAAGELDADAGVALEAEVEAAVGLGNLDGEEAHLGHAVDEGLGVLVGVLVLAGDGLDLAVYPDADVGDDLLGDGIEDVGGEVTRHSAGPFLVLGDVAAWSRP